MEESERIWILWAKKKAGEATEAEIAEIDSLFISKHSDAGNELIEQIWDTPLNSLPEINPDDTVWQQIENATVTSTVISIKNKSSIYKRLMAAASIILLVALGFVLYINLNNKEKNYSQVVVIVKTSKKYIVLPDGTKVWLNSNSKLLFEDNDFGKNYREVKLIGEAFFDVTKDAAHPFVIHAADVNITVKGTAFNVKAYPNQKNVETSLIRGLVEITTNQDPERKILLKPDEKIAVSVEENRNQQLKQELEQPLFAISKLYKEDNVLPETIWMNASLSFDNEPLEKLVPKLEGWFSVTIHIDDTTLQNKRFTGLIKSETIQETLDALKLSYPFSYKIKNDEVWIYQDQ